MKKATKTIPKSGLAALLILLVIALFSGKINVSSLLHDVQTIFSEDSMEAAKADSYVTRVVDGDTLVVMYNGNKERIRLIGVDTPESVHPDKSKNSREGKAASDYTKQALEGKSVQLEFDSQMRDKYNRLLAYVYVDGQMFNKTLLREGMAKMMTVPPNVKYAGQFKEIQQQAMSEKKGFWNTGFYQ